MPHVLVTDRSAIFESARAVEALRDHLGVGRSEAQSLADAIAAGHRLRLEVATLEAAHTLAVALREVGVETEVMAE